MVRTRDLAADLPALADFLGVPQASLDPVAAYSHRAGKRFHKVSGLDRAFLENRVQEHCGTLMAEWFLEIHSLSDSGLTS